MHAVNFASPTVLAPANLIRFGINPRQTDDGGNTALHYALRDPSEEDGDDDEDEDDEDDDMGDPHLAERKVLSVLCWSASQS
jgi:ankyrin repeat protein